MTVESLSFFYHFLNVEYSSKSVVITNDGFMWLRESATFAML